MASLQALKKHLNSIRMTGQLAGAMKTVSAVKLSRMNQTLQQFSAYDAICRQVMDTFGPALAEMFPCKNPGAPVCYVILGANRGLCGGYNIDLYNFIDLFLAKAPADRMLIAVGKHAISHLQDAGISPDKTFIFPDTVGHEECAVFMEEVLSLYREGKVSGVVILYQKFVNMLTQKPEAHVLLPLPGQGSVSSDTEPFFVPDRETVLQNAASACVNADFYTRILESCAGYQASSLIAMRSAYDNAEASSAVLESAISRRRQSDVTASVIETSGGNMEF